MSFNPQPKIKREKRKVVKQGKVAKPTKKAKSPSFKNVRNKCLQKAQRNCKIRWQVENKNTTGLVQCISCGAMIPISEIQGGHFITRNNRATEVDKDNIHPQCRTCNVLKNGNVLAYEYALKSKYGEEYVERLKNMALAREGNADVLEKLSVEDRNRVLEKHTSKWYQAESDRLDAEFNKLLDEYDSLIRSKHAKA